MATPATRVADGVINLEEFATISAAWLTHDPNDPVCDPANEPALGGRPV